MLSIAHSKSYKGTIYQLQLKSLKHFRGVFFIPITKGIITLYHKKAVSVDSQHQISSLFRYSLFLSGFAYFITLLMTSLNWLIYSVA